MRPKSIRILMIACVFGWMSPAGLGQPAPRHNRIVELLSTDQVVFGWFAPARTAEAAQRAVADGRMDFVFLNMEQVRSYSPAEVQVFLKALRTGATAPIGLPLLVRLPVFHEDPAAARRRTGEVLDLGVHGVVFPGMESEEEARDAIGSMRYPTATKAGGAGPKGVRSSGVGGAPASWGLSESAYRTKADVYPIAPDGELAAIFIVESVKGLANRRAITRTRPTVVFPGPGTLRRVFQGDMAKVEEAIQTQLAACKEFGVPCGITANASDIEKRVKEGFRMIIIYDRDYPETLEIGRRAAGRN